jgi:thiol-disulfide isomerase/thioredoxin
MFRINVLALGIAVAMIATGCSSNGSNGPQPTPDAGPSTSDSAVLLPDGPAAKTPAAIGEACEQDTDCASSLCANKTCAKGCADPADCAADQNCVTIEGKAVCVTPSYNKAIGTTCAVSGTCESGLECVGGKGTPQAICSAACQTDADCPTTMACAAASSGKQCAPREFCDSCAYDAQCGPGKFCLKQGDGTYCSRPCTAGSTECPRYAECKDVGAGQYACAHKAGSCRAEGKLCDPCGDEADCAANSLCLTFTSSLESFCAATCGTGDTCETGYSCSSISTASGSKKQCVPSKDLDYSCVGLSALGEVGAVIDDLVMVGYRDANADGSLSGEPLELLHLSDFKDSHKLILITLSAGWCGPCQQEAKDSAEVNQLYGAQGLVMFTMLFDNVKQQQRPTLDFLDQWIAQLKPGAATGIDPRRIAVPLNTKGSTPLNLLIDAKTRTVLEKWNGHSLATLKSRVEKHLPAATP